MSLLIDFGGLITIALAVIGLAFWLGQLDRKVDDHDKRLNAAAPQTDVDDLDNRVSQVEQSIREIHEVKTAQAAQGATIEAISRNVERLVRLQDDARRERA